MIYADNAATTRLSPHALEVMTDVAQNAWGNPSSLYELGQRAQETLSDARARMARILGAEPKEIYFTSGTKPSAPAPDWARPRTSATSFPPPSSTTPYSTP